MGVVRVPVRGLLLGVAFATACGLASLQAQGPAAADPPATASTAPQTPPVAATVSFVREGSAIAISRHEERLYVASEELMSIRIVALPDSGPARVVAMPGPVANLVVLPDDRVLAVVRDPGLLVLLRPDAAAGLVEVSRVPVAADAWGLAVAPDGATAFVTSAWAHTVSAVDLAGRRVRWTLDVPREPRGIVAHGSGPLYVSHLTSGAVTRIDVAADVPTAHAVDLPLAPLRAPRHGTVEGSLGYALALSPDGLRLFAARHALGVVGEQAWSGSAALDVLLVPDDRPLAPARATSLLEAHPPDTDASTYPRDRATDPVLGPFPMVTPAPFSQPRAVVYRRSTHTLLVAGEGDRAITELDALAPDPALAVVRVIPLGGEYNDPYGGCAAPSGIALSADDSTAYVYCRASFDVWSVSVSGAGSCDISWTRSIGKDPLAGEAAAGRILFYTARRSGLSEGLACSGCHPEGRDDGHVWHEVDTAAVPEPKHVAARIFVGGFGTLEIGGAPRQTPDARGSRRLSRPLRVARRRRRSRGAHHPRVEPSPVDALVRSGMATARPAGRHRAPREVRARGATTAA